MTETIEYQTIDPKKRTKGILHIHEMLVSIYEYGPSAVRSKTVFVISIKY